MVHRAASEGYQVLVCAPYGRDSATITGLLAKQGYQSQTHPNLEAVAAELDQRVGVVLLTDDALRTGVDALRRALVGHPHWSDVPFIVLAARQIGAAPSVDLVRDRLATFTNNAIVLERPLSSPSIISATATAMRARQKQFEMRDRLAELDVQYQRLNVLLESIPVGVAFIAADHSTLLSNPEFRRFRPDGSIPSLNPDASDRWEAYDDKGDRVAPNRFPAARALKGEHVPGTEYRFWPSDGEPVWTRVSATPLRASEDSGDIIGAVAVIIDIDEQKQAQASLLEAASQLEDQVSQRTAELQAALGRLKGETAERERAEDSLRQSQKMEAVGQLTGGIAHDFNNMLTGIIGSLDLMRRRIGAGRLDSIDRYMDAASASAQRAAALTQRLLAFSRRQSLDPQPVDVNQLIEAMRDLVERAVDERIDLEFILAPNLPAGVVDRHQFENAVLNLAINARDAMPNGGLLTIETGVIDLDEAYARARPGIAPGRYVTVGVSDTGVGMPPDMIDKVFDPFFTTKPIGQGTGLGLSMVYGFAQQSGGQVRIHSRVGAGTSVKLYLPTTQAQPAAAAAAEFPASAGDGERVVLIEDDPAVRMLVREVLEELRYNSIEFAEPLTAVPYLASNERIDLMISDVGLPGMTGRELAETARTHRPELPILFITGYAENAAIRAGFLRENMAMITKPFSLDELAVKIKEMLTTGRQ